MTKKVSKISLTRVKNIHIRRFLMLFIVPVLFGVLGVTILLMSVVYMLGSWLNFLIENTDNKFLPLYKLATNCWSDK